MKTSVRFLFPAAMLLVIILSSCEERTNDITGKGLVEFSVNMATDEATGSIKGPDTSIVALQLLISIEDALGNAIITDSLIPIYPFGTSYVSEKIELRSGDFRLTRFMVVNASGKIIYAAPMRESPMAYLVTKPLPLPFNVTPGQVTSIRTEMLEVKELTPDQFGYASFGITIIKPIEFWTICIIDNPLSMAAPIQLTTARLTVITPSGWKYSFNLGEKLNHLTIRGGSDIYYFLVEKEGYLPQKLQFKPEQLVNSTEANPVVLKIPFNTQLKLVELQPGPERGIDAMISNLDPDKNFGDHKYFETTFLTEPILAVMRSNRSLIFFKTDTLSKSAGIKKAVLRLAYDVPIPFDNIYIMNTGPAAGITWYGAVLQKITEPWDEQKVTWNSQPKTTEVNQVFLAPFIRNTNIIEIDVTSLFAGATVPDYGIMFRLWPTEKFPGFRFASSDYPVPEMRPKLRIFYTL